MVKSLKPATGKDNKVSKPILRRNLPTLHFNGTLPAIYCPPLVGNQVHQDCQAVEEEKLTPILMMKPLHHEQFPVDGIVNLIHLSRRFGNVGVVKQDVPARLLPFYPSAYSTAIVFARETFNLLTEPSQPLPR